MIAGIEEMMRAGRTRGRLLAPLAALALSACATSSIVPAPRLPGGSTTAPPAPAVRAPQPSHGVIGADARALIRLFGEPRLDIRDPSARKLQFGGEACILDAYLYPPKANREPVVTYAEARTADGSTMDWVDCAGRLRRR